MINEGTNTALNLETDAAGKFRAVNLTPGSYLHPRPVSNHGIPASRFDPLAARIAALYPDPQTSGVVNNYISNPEKLSVLDRGDIRIDHQITSKQTFFARYSIHNSDLHIPNTFDTRIGGNEDSFAGRTIFAASMAYSPTTTYSVRPTVIGEYRFGFTKIPSVSAPRATDRSGMVPNIRARYE